jgi:hypothetical protein
VDAEAEIESVLTPHSLFQLADDEDAAEEERVEVGASVAVALLGRATHEFFLFLTFRFVLSDDDRFAGDSLSARRISFTTGT